MFQISFQLTEDNANILNLYFATNYSSNWTIQEIKEENRTLLRGYFESEADMELAKQKLGCQIPNLYIESDIELLPDCNWQDEYKKHFKAWTISGMHWVPEWQRNEYLIPENETAIFLDPGLAFGMMDHPSTHLCIQILMEFYENNEKNIQTKSMIDVGCGSGILSITAAALDFGTVWGFDFDPIAVKISENNAQFNNLGNKVNYDIMTIESAMIGKFGDLILANVLSSTQINNAKVLLNAINPQGILGLSGILNNELDELVASFTRIIDQSEFKYDLKINTMENWSSVTIYRHLF